MLVSDVKISSVFRGISDEALELSDLHCSIPMNGMVDSFNVSVAAGILMHHAVCDRTSRLVTKKKNIFDTWIHYAIRDLCRILLPGYLNKGESSLSLGVGMYAELVFSSIRRMSKLDICYFPRTIDGLYSLSNFPGLSRRSHIRRKTNSTR